jgi:hypothetical protein
MIRIFISSLTVLSLISCTLDTERNRLEVKRTPLQYEMVIEEFQDDSCDQENYCAHVSFEFPEYDDGYCAEHLDSLARAFLLVPSFGSNEITHGNTKDVARAFILEYRKELAEFPDMSGVYELSRSVQFQYSCPAFVCMLMSEYVYTGGAHGNSHHQFYNIDQYSCKIWSWEDVFRNWTEDSLSHALKLSYLKSKGLDETNSLYDAGLWVEELEPGNNFGILEDRVIFFYNSYEVASYAEGPVEVILPIPAEFKDSIAFR